MMLKTHEAVSPIQNARERIIVALDVDNADEAAGIVGELAGKVGAFKIGLQLFLAAGPDFVKKMCGAGTKIFLDLKFHDIPNTVAKASIEAAKMGVWMFNVHASGGREMMVRTKGEVSEACSGANINVPLIIGVTVLTSSDQHTLSEIGVDRGVERQVAELAKLTFESGLDGVVASPNEVKAVRLAVEDQKFLTVTPGIRPNDATLDDQKRVSTFGQALANGSNYVVIGRPVTQAKDRLAAVEEILDKV